MNHPILKTGKLPLDLLRSVINKLPVKHPRLVKGPGIGFDCAVVDNGANYLVYTTDPITFVTAETGWYLVQVNANDIATTGAVPKWLLVTLLLPEKQTDQKMIETIMEQIGDACNQFDITVIGGHTEITGGVTRPIAVGTMIGEVKSAQLVLPDGAQSGDRILLTKTVPIEATAILAREFPDRLDRVLSQSQVEEAQNYLYQPGISVLKDAQTAVNWGNVTAMHDPTEGGIYSALWELSHACNHAIRIDRDAIPTSDLSRSICQEFDIDPMQSIASGALLITAPTSNVPDIKHSLTEADILCTEIGEILDEEPGLYHTAEGKTTQIPLPERDEIARVFEGGS